MSEQHITQQPDFIGSVPDFGIQQEEASPPPEQRAEITKVPEHLQRVESAAADAGRVALGPEITEVPFARTGPEYEAPQRGVISVPEKDFKGNPLRAIGHPARSDPSLVRRV